MQLITQEKVQAWIPTRDPHTYKNRLGHVLCVGGTAQMGGAILLSAGAALATGAGLVSVASAPENLSALHARQPEIMFNNMYKADQLIPAVQRADVIVLGPGLGLDNQSLQVFQQVLENLRTDQNLLIDADGITAYHQLKRPPIKAKNFILTPHRGEWRRLTGIEANCQDPKRHQAAQAELQATVVLKGSPSQVYFNNQIWQNTCGNPAMATGGMGDTLTGIIASLVGQLDHYQEAVLAAVYLHSYIGDLIAQDHYVALPSRIIEELPRVMREFSLGSPAKGYSRRWRESITIKTQKRQ